MALGIWTVCMLKPFAFRKPNSTFLLQQVVIPEIGLFWAVGSSFLDNLHSTTLFEHKTAVSGADLEEVLERFVIRDLLVLGGERGGGRTTERTDSIFSR